MKRYCQSHHVDESFLDLKVDFRLSAIPVNAINLLSHQVLHFPFSEFHYNVGVVAVSSVVFLRFCVQWVVDLVML